MTSFAIGSNHPEVDILALADVMESQGLHTVYTTSCGLHLHD